MDDTTTDHGTNTSRICRDKKSAEDSKQAMRTIVAIKIVQTARKQHTYFYLRRSRQETKEHKNKEIGHYEIGADNTS